MFYSPNASPKAPSSPISMGWPGTSPSSPNSSTSSVSSNSSSLSLSQNNWAAASTCHSSLSCAFPSWPSRNSLSPPMKANDAPSSSSYTNNNNVASSYISDFDLFPEDLEDESMLPCLDSAPAEPRNLPMPPKLMPLFAPDRPRKQRRRSSKKTKAVTSPMSPIAE